MQTRLNTSSAHYISKDSSPDFLALADGESVTYNFSTIKNMDTFWGHTWNVIMASTPTSNPLFIYDPHYWFYFARNELERKFQKEITASKRQYFMTVEGKTPLDKIIRKDFTGQYLQYNHNNIFNKGNYYLTIIGDYIAETYLDREVSKKIKNIFNANMSVTPDVVADLKEILEAKVKSKFKISRNKKRADKLKKKLSKGFYVMRAT
jgi:hypothetical protein